MVDTMIWAEALGKLKSYIFKINTPNNSGTGFIITCDATNNLYGIATAYHVISHAHVWEEPIKIIHAESRKQITLRVPERFIFANQKRDIATIMFMNKDINLPKVELTLAPEDKHLKPGIKVGWAGFPVLAPDHFSFFNGVVSCFLNDDYAYLVDGVAINGVSGGPAFTVFKNNIQLIGVVSAYIPNRATGESLPGVCFVVGINPFYDFIKDIKSVEEASEKAKEIETEPPNTVDGYSKAGPTATTAPPGDS